MVERNVQAMVTAIRDWEWDAGESFTDYFLDNWPFGSWVYWLLGKGYTDFTNDLINRNEAGEYISQDEKFYIHCDPWDESSHIKNVTIWAEFLTESDQYYRRVNEFFKKESENNES